MATLARPGVGERARAARAALDPGRVRGSARPLAIAAGLAAAALVAFHPDTLTLPQALLAATVGVVGLVPAFRYLRAGAVDPVPLMPLLGLFHGVAFGFVAFFPSLNWLGVDRPAITTALWLGLAGIGGLYAGHAAGGPLFRRLRPLRIVTGVGPPALRLFAWAFFAAHLAHQFIPRVAAVPSLQHFLAPLGWLAMGLLYMQFLRGQLPLGHRLLFFGLALPAELFSRFITGALYEFFMVFVFLFFIYWQMRRRVPWMLGVALVAAFALLNPVKFNYRLAVKMMPADASPIVKAQTFFSLTAAYYSGRTEAAPEIAADSSLNRLGHVAYFAYVLERTPEVIPYWGGETYSYFLSAFVPRALWSEKPSAAFGNDFGQRYHLLARGVYDTSINLPWLVEFFVNFGPLAVPLGMALIGLVVRALVQKVSNPAANDCEYVLGLTLCLQLFWAESNLTIMWGGLLQTALVLYVLLCLVARRWRW